VQSASDDGPRSDLVSRTLRLGLAIAFLLFVAQSTIGLVAALVLNSYDSILDLDRNNGVPDLLSTGAIVAAAFAAVELAAAESGSHRWQATALALLLSMAALDDLLQEEARLGNPWGVSVVVTLVTLALLILAIARRAPRGAGVTLLIGLCLLAVAVKNAYEYDQFLNVLGRGDQERGDLDYELGIVLKQGLEFLGWSLVAIGIWATALAAGAGRRRLTFEVRQRWPRPGGAQDR
jgi:hypothetical protein